MKLFSVTVAVSGLVSTAALAVLVAADRQLGVPVPYAVSCVVALLNVAAGLAIALPRRIVFAPTLVPKPLRLPMPAANAPKVVHAAAPIDEAVVWFETALAAAKEEAA